MDREGIEKLCYCPERENTGCSMRDKSQRLPRELYPDQPGALGLCPKWIEAQRPVFDT